MKPEPKPGRKTLLSPEKEGLAREWIANLPDWAEKAPLLAVRLAPSSAEEGEAFFARLLAGAKENALPLFETLRGKSEGLDEALARGLGHAASPWAVEFLVRWAGNNPAKNVKKEIRKSLFRLKSKGVPVPDLEDPAPGVFRPPRVESSAQGYASAVDARGSRLVWIGLPQPAQGFHFISCVLSDTEGILDLTAYESSRKKFQDFMEQNRRDMAWDIVEIDPAYGAAMIHEAHEVQTGQGKTPNPEYLRIRTLLGPIPSLPLRPLIYSFLSEEEIKARSDLLERSPLLFEGASFQVWFLEKEEVARCLELLEDAAQSRIILAPHQQESRFFEIYRQTVEELFDEKRRLHFRRRLEEMAYVLWKKGDESGAKISVAAALALTAGAKLLAPHPFLMELVKRTVLALRQESRREREKEKEGGLIIRP
jgi:hypothetical protein